MKNVGNQHFVIHALHVKGKNTKGEEVYSREMAGWYLLSGASRVYQTSIPREICLELDRVEIELKTDQSNLVHQLHAHPNMCLPGR